MTHLTRTVALVAIVAAALIGAGTFAALAQTASSASRSAGGVRGTVPATASAPTPPPLPLGDQSRPLGMRANLNPGARTDELTAFARLPAGLRAAANTRFVPYRGPRPSIPKLSDLLAHKARHTLSASGGTIVLTGTSSVPYLDDQTLSYGAQVYWLCENLKPSTTYQYLVFPPDGTAYKVQTRNYPATSYVSTFTTDTTGRCEHVSGGLQYPYYAEMELQTPLAATPDPVTGIGPTRTGATDNPYSGVWTIAVQNTTTSAYEAVAYSVVIGTLNFSTYSNSGFSTKSNDFASGATVYVAASGLNPAHFYSFGFINTSGNGLPCVYTIPTGSQNWNNGTCFTSGAVGILPTSQALSGGYSTPATGNNAVGTQTVQLYDATTNDLISTQQISVNPSSIAWSPLIPYNGATNGTNLGDTFATDGLLGSPGGTGINQEQSVQGLIYQAQGVTSGHTYALTVSNSNGVVLSSTTTDTAPAFGSPQFFSAPSQFTASSTNTGAQKLAFPINSTNFTSFGATQIPFAPNMYTAQLYDVTAATVVGSKSFTILSYDGAFQWTNPAGAYVNANAAGAATSVTTTLRNDGGVLFGSWNADSIASVTIRSDSGNVVGLGRQGGVTTTTDSLGQTWNITNPNAQTITLTPAVAGESLPVNGTLPIPITVSVATGKCATACVLQTQITPLHGVAASTYNSTMTNCATNGLSVYGNGVTGSNTYASYSWSVGNYSGAQLAAPRYGQAMYRSGTNAATGGTYPLTITINNNGAAKPMYNIEFVFPATVNPNQTAPTIASAIVNGATVTTDWNVYVQDQGVGSSGYDTNLGPSAFALVETKTAGTGSIPVGKSATFVLNMPIQSSAFPFQEIAATANYDNIAGITAGVGTAYTVGPTNVQTNDVAGTTNIDTTELGIFSLDTSLMSASISPVVVPALANSSWTFTFLNTSTGLDPNPDYISQLLLTVPSAGGVYPAITSVTASNGATFNANATGTAGQWLLDLCAVNAVPNATTQAYTPCTTATDANALPPGGTLTVNLKYATAPAVGSYAVDWTVVGANGGAVVAASGSQNPTLTVANTTAQTSFTYAGGYTATPAYPPVAPITAVPANSQPVIGSWSNYNDGNAFVYELYNNGSTNITNVSLSIPSSNTSGQYGDASGWKVIASTIYTYGAGASGSSCSGNNYGSISQPTPGSPGTQGLLQLSGCNVAPGQKLDIFFYAQNPYDATLSNPVFAFNASVATGGATPPDPRTTANINTLPIYSQSNTIRIVVDARLAIEIPSGSGPYSYSPALFGASNPSIVCPNCTFNSAGSSPLINLNNITGSVTVGDSLAASVYSDSTNGWSLSVSADQNPSTSSGQLSTWMVPGSSSAPTTGTYTISASHASPGTVVPTSGTLSLASFTGAVRKQPIDNIMSYLVTVNPLSVNNNQTTTVTLTYTLIAN
ncbi:MAG TPA: hypothetical protein VHT05_01460 [Candidatus Elarobacter sp.]|nr:hypothetical protein [Candidatus Elarobacter sp.]